MKYLVVKNFDRFQHYRDRNPPWIKLHAELLTDVAFLQLHEAAQAQLIKLWIIASQFGNPLPYDPKLLAGKIGAVGKFRLAEIISAGFLIPCNDLASVDASNPLAHAEDSASRNPANLLAKPSSPRARADSESEVRGLIDDDDFPAGGFSLNGSNGANVVGAVSGASGVNGGGPELSALYLTIWANKAVTEHWGEQPSPYGQAGAVQLAQDLATAGVEWPIARLSIYRQCRESKQPRPPRSQSYFRRGIEEDWGREIARREASCSNESPPPADATAQLKRTSGPRARTRENVGESTYSAALAAAKSVQEES